MSGHIHTYIHTHRTTTVTLAAHARRGLIIIVVGVSGMTEDPGSGFAMMCIG